MGFMVKVYCEKMTPAETRMVDEEMKLEFLADTILITKRE